MSVFLVFESVIVSLSISYLVPFTPACIIFCSSTSNSLYYFYLACIFFYGLYCFSFKKDTGLSFYLVLFTPSILYCTCIVLVSYLYCFTWSFSLDPFCVQGNNPHFFFSLSRDQLFFLFIAFVLQ